MFVAREGFVQGHGVRLGAGEEEYLDCGLGRSKKSIGQGKSIAPFQISSLPVNVKEVLDQVLKDGFHSGSSDETLRLRLCKAWLCNWQPGCLWAWGIGLTKVATLNALVDRLVRVGDSASCVQACPFLLSPFIMSRLGKIKVARIT